MKVLGALLLVLVVLGLVGLGIAHWVVSEAFGEEYERFRSIQPGMAEHEVIAALGEPFKIYYRETAPEDYYIDGYSFKRRDITYKVFIYVGTEPIAYIYFDQQNKVEDTFVGGS